MGIKWKSHHLFSKTIGSNTKLPNNKAGNGWVSKIWLLNQLNLKYYSDTYYIYFFPSFYITGIFSLDIWGYAAFFSVFNAIKESKILGTVPFLLPFGEIMFCSNFSLHFSVVTYFFIWAFGFGYKLMTEKTNRFKLLVLPRRNAKKRQVTS